MVIFPSQIGRSVSRSVYSLFTRKACTVFAHGAVHGRTVVVRAGWMMAIWTRTFGGKVA